MKHNAPAWRLLRAVAGAAADGIVSAEIIRLSGLTFDQFLRSTETLVLWGYLEAYFPPTRSIPSYRITAAGRRILEMIERNSDDPK